MWSFADAYLMPKLQNMAMKILIDLFQLNPISVECVRIAFEVDADGPLRIVCVREALYDIQAECGKVKPEIEDFSVIPGFFVPFVKQMHACHGYCCDHETDCTPSLSKDYKTYSVAERAAEPYSTTTSKEQDAA